VITCTTTRLPTLPGPGYGAHCVSHPGFLGEMGRITAHCLSKSSRCSQINQTAMVLVFSPYLLGIVTTIPNRRCARSPGWFICR
jgi:hypothetical protein